MLTRNNLLWGTMAAGALVIVLLAGALYDPLSLRSWWKDVQTAKTPFNDERALYDTAYGHFHAKDDLIARDVTRRLLKVSPRSARGHKLMAALHLRDENFVGALGESRIAAQLDPADPMAQMAVAESLKGLGDKEGARKAFEQLTRNPFAPDRLKDQALSGVKSVSKPTASKQPAKKD